MHTENKIVIDASPDVVFRLAAEVEHWPEMLAHYRYVTVLKPKARIARKKENRTVKMAARRTGIPVSWTSTQRVDGAARRVEYTHIAGATKGMDVLWTIDSRAGGCRVAIFHDLHSCSWWLRLRPISFVVARWFVQHIADRTLRGIKVAAEATSSVAAK